MIDDMKMRICSFSRRCYKYCTESCVSDDHCSATGASDVPGLSHTDTGYGGGSDTPPGHWKLWPGPDSSMSRMRVSIGVLPTSLTKKSCSITEADTVLREGSLSSSLPNLVGWLGYWVLQYSSNAHWDFSCSCSIVPDWVRPHASTTRGSEASSQESANTKEAFCVITLLLSETLMFQPLHGADPHAHCKVRPIRSNCKYHNA